MSQRREQPPQRRSDHDRELLGWLKEFFEQFGLAWRLLWDRRVPLTAKLIPVLAVLYVLSPIDILPDAILGLGQVDDLMILMVGLRMFISMAPPNVVSEYEHLPGDQAPDGVWGGRKDDIIDLDAHVPDDSEK